MAKIGRNDPCPCGSGKKYKRCCQRRSLLQRYAGISIDRVPDLLDWLVGFLGQQWYQRKLRALSVSKVGAARILTQTGVHPLVAGLAEYARMKTNGEDMTEAATSAAIMGTAADAWNLRFIGQYVPGALSSNSLIGRLKSDENAASLLFEINVAVHFLQQGCSVDLPEVTTDSPIDVLAKFDTYEVEIQCKRKGLGSGRKIPNPLFDRLVAEVYESWSEARSRFAIRLRCADRLDAGHVHHLGETISDCLKSGWTGTITVLGDSYTLTIEQIGPKDDLVQAGATIDRLYRLFDDLHRPPHLALLDWAPTELPRSDLPVNPSYFLCQSEREDRVLDNVLDSLREGARQLTGDKPGIVAVHIPEPVSRDTLERGLRPTALGLALGRSSEVPDASLGKASAVLISGESLSPFEGGVWCGDFPVVLFHNPRASHPLPQEPPYSSGLFAKAGADRRS